MDWQGVVERTVTGLGYDLVSTGKTAGGLLRVFVDLVARKDGSSTDEEFITVEDCEKITRQLQHVLEVEGCAYERLEVSSPGLDRPLNKVADYERFVGSQVEIVLKRPFKDRKKYSGELQKLGEGWRLILASEPVARSVAKRAPKHQEDESESALDFLFEEVREAHLVPVLDFKGLRFLQKSNAQAGDAQTTVGAELGLDDGIDGGHIQ
jgi:ribosome maturation factor RimP